MLYAVRRATLALLGSATFLSACSGGPSSPLIASGTSNNDTSLAANVNGGSVPRTPDASYGTSSVSRTTASQSTLDAYSSAVLASGPSAYYRLDDTGSVAVDSSPNGLNGAIGVKVIKSVPGLVASSSDTAMTFPGVRNGFVVVPPATPLQVATQVSMECFLRFSEAPQDYSVPFAYGSDIRFAPYDLYFRAGKINARFVLSSGTLTVTAPTVLQANATYYIVATFDGTKASIYVNGTLAASQSKAGTITGYDQKHGLALGDDAGFTDAAFAGTLDEVAIYSHVLSQSDISAHFSAALAAIPAPTPSQSPRPVPSPTLSPRPAPTPSPTSSPVPPGARRAMWVWTAPDNQTLVNFAKAHNVQELFYSVSSNITGSELTRLQDLKTRTDAAGLILDALGGDSAWVFTPSGAIAWANDAIGTHLFAGLHFDIEPNQLSDWGANQAADAAQYVKAVGQIKAANPTVHTEMDVQFSWGSIPVNGYASMADGTLSKVDEITIMSYRNIATGGNGMFDIGKDELARAATAGKPARLGAETNNVQPAELTFYGNTTAQMNAVLAQVDTLAGTYSSYRGIAVEDYFGWNNLRNASP